MTLVELGLLATVFTALIPIGQGLINLMKKLITIEHELADICEKLDEHDLDHKEIEKRLDIIEKSIIIIQKYISH